MIQFFQMSANQKWDTAITEDGKTLSSVQHGINSNKNLIITQLVL